jgi:uncharacterized protein
MKIAIAGGTGFVGKKLTADLLRHGHEVFILTRKSSDKLDDSQTHIVQWLTSDSSPEEALQGVEVIINLAGESINSGRWSEARKKSILQSRLTATEEIIRIMNSLPQKPKVLINASAVGIYGTSLTKTFVESEISLGTDFLARTVIEWESKASEALMLRIRTVFCRFGIILDKDDGALPRIAMPYKLFAGGTVGNGEQWVSWIHLDDVINGIQFAMTNENISGPVNFTAPQPVTMKEFGKAVGTVLHRPHWIPAPSFALKTLLGEMSILVLEGQRVQPEKLLENGFVFTYPSLAAALKNIFC